MIKFVWNLHFKCNYRCEYCNFKGQWEELKQENKYYPLEELVQAWDRIYDKYGSVEIHFVGGEPCVYPSFTELAIQLSKKHYLGMTTNLSIDFTKFANEISPERVSFGIGASFHPQYASLEDFLNKALMLKEKDFKIWINYVAYLPQLSKMEYYKNIFSKHGFPFVVQPYRGKYKGKKYPESYSEEERKLIRKVAGNDPQTLRDMKYQLERKKTKGKLCRAGQELAHIRPDGGTKRCGDIHELIGNIFNEDFKLLDEPLPCPVEFCPCDHLYLVEGEDTREAVVNQVGSERKKIEKKEVLNNLMEESEYYLFEKGDFDKAESLAKKVLQKDEKNTWGIRILARIYREKFQRSKGGEKEFLKLAYEQIKNGLEIDRENPWINIEAACVFREQGRVRKARRSVDIALDKEPENEYFQSVEKTIRDLEVNLGLKKKNKKLKIALVLTPGWGREAPPYTLALLAGILREKGYETEIFDVNNLLYHKHTGRERQLWNWEEFTFWTDPKSVEQYVEDNNNLINSVIVEILSSECDVVGFSAYFTTKLMSLEVARRIKRKDDKKVVIFGGTECQRKVNWEDLINESVVDAVFLDEADESLPNFLDIMREKRGFGYCPGVVYKENGSIIDCGERESKDIDNIPFADYSDFNFDSYGYPDNIKISFSRGCTEGCAYCSARTVWKNYRTMSGKRIFNELRYQIEKYQERMKKQSDVHIMFLDSLVNGNMKVFKEWVTKLANFRQRNSLYENFSWSAQIIIRPEMTLDIVKKAKKSGCIELNYGIESGSAKVLKDMRKRYTPEVAERVVKDIYNAGVPAKANFMVGFPTETEEDFQRTLDFVKRNGQYMDQIYISRTFCSLERFSYLTRNKEQFGINPETAKHHLFWETKDGKNNYLIRLDRYIRFCNLVNSFPHDPLVTGVEDLERDKWLWLGKFYQYKESYRKALESYDKYVIEGGNERSVSEAKRLCKQKVKSKSFNVKKHKNLNNKKIHDNAKLNDKEFKNQKIKLNSTPHNVFMQIDAPCNHNCVFCSRPEEYSNFNLEKFKNKFKNMRFVFKKALQIHLTGAGEFLLLPDADKILRYFDKQFPFSEKVFATNGTTFSDEVIKVIENSDSNFTIQFSLHASNPELHESLTCKDDFSLTIRNLKKLIQLCDKKYNLDVSVMFLITAKNIENLPNFIKMIDEIGVKELNCEYNSIYNVSQRPLSCYFKKSITNQILGKVEDMAENLNMEISLPPKFKQPKEYYDSFIKENTYFGKDRKLRGKCSELWQNVMVNYKGEIIPCCHFKGGSVGNIFEEDFYSIWNSEIYQNLRREFSENEIASVCKECPKFNPHSIDDIKAHVITRGKSNKELENLLNPELAEEEIVK